MIEQIRPGESVFGEVELTVLEAGKPIDRQRVNNVVTTAGWGLLAEVIRGVRSPVTHVALGTGSRTPAAADTALQTEVYRDIATSLSSIGRGLTTSHFLPTFAAAGHTLREVGLFTAAAGGILFARALLDREVAKTDRITATIIWTIRFGGG